VVRRVAVIAVIAVIFENAVIAVTAVIIEVVITGRRSLYEVSVNGTLGRARDGLGKVETTSDRQAIEVIAYLYQEIVPFVWRLFPCGETGLETRWNPGLSLLAEVERRIEAHGRLRVEMQSFLLLNMSRPAKAMVASRITLMVLVGSFK
jgi:hypothetical protein